MITERSDPEMKTLFMLLVNMAQSELANQNRRIWRRFPALSPIGRIKIMFEEYGHAQTMRVPTVNNNMAAAIVKKIKSFR